MASNKTRITDNNYKWKKMMSIKSFGLFCTKVFFFIFLSRIETSHCLRRVKRKQDWLEPCFMTVAEITM